MTKLEAVNRILEALGNEAPASALDTGGTSVVAEAENFLDRYNTELQRDGWNVNTTYSKTYTPDGSNHIDVAANVLAVTRSPYTTVCIKVIGTRVWNTTDNTDEWTEAQRFHVVEEIAFTDLPVALARYITAYAALKFARYKKRSAEDDAFLRDEVQDALVDARREDEDQSCLNVLDTPEAWIARAGRHPNQRYGGGTDNERYV